jgi:hypothetical protein
MGDYDYYEEPQPVPTFSDGSSGGGRGANSRAAASRASASKTAVSAASRASAIMTASIQQLPKNSIITSNGIRSIQKPSGPGLNMAAIKAAQKRSEDVMRTVKPPEPIIIKQPVNVVANIPTSTTILKPLNTDAINRSVAKSEIYVSDVYKAAVDLARIRKEELLLSLEPSPLIEQKKYGQVKYTIYETSDDIAINNAALEKLTYNVSRLQANRDKTLLLGEFNKCQSDMRISIEEPIHKNAFQKALTNKASYLTSDA